MRGAALVLALLLSACVLPGAAPSRSPERSPAASPSAATAVAVGFDAALAKRHVDYLADPARGGRYTASTGYRDAANYVAERFREIGLEPAGDNGTYFQHFTMPLVDLAAMPVLQTPQRTYRPRVDFTESVGGRSGSGAAETTIVVVGGAARTGGQNDFEGVDPRGKVALITGPFVQGGGSVVEAAYSEGAVGVIVIGGATLRYSYTPRFQTATIPTLVVSETVANELIAASGKSVSDAQSAARARRSDATAPSPAFEVPTTVRMSVSLTPLRDVSAMNVVGLLRAPDESNNRRALLVGGHLDGVGTDPDGTVFPAANDNASGPAVMIEVARALASVRSTLAHSVVFAAFAGEEQGFYGSDAYVIQTASTPGRVESLVAMLNLDVIGCCSDTLIVSNEAPDLQRRIRDVATGLGVANQSVSGGGSDQTSFSRRRVPAVLIGFSEYVLHTYDDTPDRVLASRLKKAGDVITEVAKDLARGS